MLTCQMHQGYFGYGFVFNSLIIAVFFLIVWWILRNNDAKPKESAKDILKKRLAKGEISEKEFNRLKKEIE